MAQNCVKHVYGKRAIICKEMACLYHRPHKKGEIVENNKPDGRAKPRRETCKRGLHAMTPENVWVRPSDGRHYCRACQKETPSYKRNNLKSQSDMCRRGLHPRAPENTFITRDGRKYCLSCVWDDRRAARQAKRGRPDDEGSVSNLVIEQAKGWEVQLKEYLDTQTKRTK
jgi:hypothetical protein